MDLEWGSDGALKFITNVGLVTSNGSVGQNIMSCEWTKHVSYSPGLIAVSIKETSATLKNIRETKEFGVSLAANDQNVLASVSGGSTGTETDKIKVLEELGFEFYKAKNIDVMMVKGAALNLECKLIKEIELGSHIMFVGEVVDVIVNDKEPLGMHKGRYWKMDTPIEKPPQEELDKINKITEKHSK